MLKYCCKNIPIFISFNCYNLYISPISSSHLYYIFIQSFLQQKRWRYVLQPYMMLSVICCKILENLHIDFNWHFWYALIKNNVEKTTDYERGEKNEVNRYCEES